MGRDVAKWGTSQVEFRALWPEIKRRQDDGESLNRIYDALHQDGRITMSRSAFYQIKGRMAAAVGGAVVPRLPPSRPSPLSQNRALGSAVITQLEWQGTPDQARVADLWEGLTNRDEGEASS